MQLLRAGHRRCIRWGLFGWSRTHGRLRIGRLLRWEGSSQPANFCVILRRSPACVLAALAARA